MSRALLHPLRLDEGQLQELVPEWRKWRRERTFNRIFLSVEPLIKDLARREYQRARRRWRFWGFGCEDLRAVAGLALCEVVETWGGEVPFDVALSKGIHSRFDGLRDYQARRFVAPENRRKGG